VGDCPLHINEPREHFTPDNVHAPMMPHQRRLGVCAQADRQGYPLFCCAGGSRLSAPWWHYWRSSSANAQPTLWGIMVHGIIGVMLIPWLINVQRAVAPTNRQARVAADLALHDPQSSAIRSTAFSNAVCSLY